MTVRDAVYNRLSGFADLTALVSTRVYHMHLPQAPVYPAVTYQVISGLPIPAMGVDVANTTRVQVTAFANTDTEADSIRVQIEAALNRWRGTEPTSGLQIKSSFKEGEADEYDAGGGLFMIPVDFLITTE